jgi:hypothetical protein
MESIGLLKSIITTPYSALKSIEGTMIRITQTKVDSMNTLEAID